jgi:hypothetical protein
VLVPRTSSTPPGEAHGIRPPNRRGDPGAERLVDRGGCIGHGSDLDRARGHGHQAGEPGATRTGRGRPGGEGARLWGSGYHLPPTESSLSQEGNFWSVKARRTRPPSKGASA